MSQAQLVQSLIAAGQRLDARGWVPGGGGNFSARLGEHACLVTASGRHKGHLRQADFARVDLQGHAADGAPPVSAETGLHCERYRALPDVGCVLHTHSVAATLVGRAHREAELCLSGYEMQKAFAGVRDHEATLVIPLFDNDQNIERLAEAVAARHQQSAIDHGYLIRGHGLYTWGADVETALCRVEALEFLLECELREQRS